MGININRKCFAIDLKNYIKINDIVFSLNNKFLDKDNESHWKFFYNIYFNKESRDLEKICKKIKNKEVDIPINSEIEQQNLDNLLTLVSTPKETKVSTLNDMNIQISANHLINKNHHPLFKGYTLNDMYKVSYQLVHEGRSFFGNSKEHELEDDLEDEVSFIKRMKKYILDKIKEKK